MEDIYEEQATEEAVYNRHYIRTDENNSIIRGFSDAFEQPQSDDICINEQGGYQFRIFDGGEENPSLTNDDGIALYKWDGKAVKARTKKEIAVDTPEPLQPQPTETEKLYELVTGLYATLENVGVLNMEDVPNTIRRDIERELAQQQTTTEKR